MQSYGAISQMNLLLQYFSMYITLTVESLDEIQWFTIQMKPL